MSRSVPWLIFQNELLLIKRSRVRLLLALVVPGIGALLPALLVLSASSLVYLGNTGQDALMSVLVGYAKTMAPLFKVDLPEVARWLALRISSSYFVLTPWVIIPISGAFAIAAERERRTLEPMLATPISSAGFAFGKLLALGLPATLITYVAAALSWALAAAVVYFQHGMFWLPDLAWLLSVVLLPPLMAWHCSALSLGISLSARDPQSAAQITSLVVIPVFMLVLTSMSLQWVSEVSWVLGTAGVVLLFAPLSWFWLLRSCARRQLLRPR